MRFEVSKIENCFADSKSFEYILPADGREMLAHLEGFDIRLNEKLRRPVGIAQRGRLIIKFLLEGKSFRVSFPEDDWQREKEKFESFLEMLPCTE